MQGAKPPAGERGVPETSPKDMQIGKEKGERGVPETSPTFSRAAAGSVRGA